MTKHSAEKLGIRYTVCIKRQGELSNTTTKKPWEKGGNVTKNQKIRGAKRKFKMTCNCSLPKYPDEE